MKEFAWMTLCFLFAIFLGWVILQNPPLADIYVWLYHAGIFGAAVILGLCMVILLCLAVLLKR